MANTVKKGLVSKSALTAIGDAIRAKNGSTTKYKPSEMAAAISELKSDKFNFKVVQSAYQIINSTPIGKTVSNPDGTVSLVLTDTTTISPNTNYIPGAIQRSYDDSTHTYTVTATDAEPIDGLVQDGWSVVYQYGNEFYSNSKYTGEYVYGEKLQGNILIGGMKSNNEVYYLRGAKNISKFKNTFVTSVGDYFLQFCENLTHVELPNLTSAGDYVLQSCENLTHVELPNLTSAGDYVLKSCKNLTHVELPNLTSAGYSFLQSCENLTYVELPNLTSARDYVLQSCENLTHVELPNLTSAGEQLMHICYNLRSVEVPKLTTLSGSQYQLGGSSPMYFIDFGYTTNIATDNFYNTQVMVLRSDTVPTKFAQSKLSDPVLYIVPSALVDTYKSKVRSQDYVTALEKSPFADGKTVCGNNMKTAYVYGRSGETPALGEGTMLWYNSINWKYITHFDDPSDSNIPIKPEKLSGFYFLSKLTKEKGYTIPT